jgi:ribonucleoside-diphosphate reductase alpha chain
MYMHAWKTGLKTTYYLRSRPATRINQTTSDRPVSATVDEKSKSFSDEEAVACSLENPETCEACD